jgi:hypothetical protein
MNTKIHRWAAPWLAAVIVAGCGGGGDGGGFAFFPPPSATPPAAQPPAAADPYDTFIAYVKGLIASALDAAEPADVAAFDPPPTSDSKDPISTQ